MQTILVIDDDESLRDTISLILERENFQPILASDGRSGLELALARNPDLILVDLRLPEMTGNEVCKKLRASRMSTPIIVVSAAGDEVDKVLLLELGADDYIVKPFGTRELMARIRAVLRRSGGERTTSVAFSNVEVDLDTHIVKVGGEEIKFTPAEYNLLAFFLQSPDRILSRDVILSVVWGYESYPNTRTVDAHIVRLRQKLESDPTNPRHFRTVHGLGYRFTFKAG